MSRKIHPAAVVDPAAQLADDVEIGPYAVVEADVKIGPRTRLHAHAVVLAHTELGADCAVHSGAVLGDAPQDISYTGAPTRAVLGSRVLVREHVTVHRATKLEHPTTVEDDCFLMAHSHVAHDCHVGAKAILVNGALLAGHVHIGRQAIVSGNTVVHQFVRVGRLAILSGLSGFGMDVPPFLIGHGINSVAGLNSVGLRRCQELTGDDREQLKAAFRILYRSGLTLNQALERLKGEFTSAAVKEWVAFFSQPTRRGYCRYRARRGEGEG